MLGRAVLAAGLLACCALGSLGVVRAGADSEGLKAQIRDFYSEHNPAKLKDLPKMFSKCAIADAPPRPARPPPF